MPEAVTAESVPGIGTGTLITWKVYKGIVDPGPWEFAVERSDNGIGGPWIRVSALIRGYSWTDPSRVIISKDAPLHYRVVLRTGVKTYTSPPVSFGGSLSRERTLLLKELMRRETLYASRNTNSSDANVYIRNLHGTPCDTCLDPVTGSAVLGNACPVCGGARTRPPFLGPYPVLTTLAKEDRKTVNSPDGVGRINPDTQNMRVAGPVWIRTRDIVKVGEKLFHVEASDSVAEVGQVPVAQMVTANPLPLGDPLYTLEIFR